MGSTHNTSLMLGGFTSNERTGYSLFYFTDCALNENTLTNFNVTPSHLIDGEDMSIVFVGFQNSPLHRHANQSLTVNHSENVFDLHDYAFVLY